MDYFTLLLSTAAAILWFVALALWLRASADCSAPDQPPHPANGQRA
jgi:hypothetical protein